MGKYTGNLNGLFHVILINKIDMTQVFNFPKGKWLVRYMEIPKDRVDIRGSGWEQRGHTICSLRTETPVLGTRHEHGTCKGCSGELHHPGM